MLMGTHVRPPAALGIRGFKVVFITFAILLLLLPSSSLWAHAAPVDNNGESPAVAVAALLRFKSTLSYASAFDTWNPSTSPSPCRGDYGLWRGVLCMDGHVWGLQLENMGLSGRIDVDALLPLRFLRTISLINNNFSGPMPDWTKLGSLKSLFLSNNRFSGQIPNDAFKDMTSLKKVYLGNNQFTGTIPTSLSTPRLLELKIENNQFAGLIPELRPGLRVLDMSNNQLEGPIPSTLANMDPASFHGNKNVCGPPLETPCNNPLGPLPDQTPLSISRPTEDPHADASSGAKFVIYAMVGLLALVIIIVLLAIFWRSRKDQTPSQVRTQKRSASRSGSSTEDQLKVVGMEPTVPLMPAAGGATSNVKKAKAHDTNKLCFVRDDRQQFDLQDLLRASAEVLGSGNFGSSYKAVLMDGQAVVVKRFKQMNNVGREDFHEHMRRLGRLIHPNLLPLVAYYYRKEEKLFVFDYIQNGSLASHLHGKHSVEQPALDWPTRLKIVKGVTKGLAYLHAELPSMSLPHGHLKSSNVVLDKSFQPLLMDYALVPVVNPGQVQNMLVAYKSPEYEKSGRTTRKTDVWNLGILILEILTSKFPANFILAQDPAPRIGSPSSYYSYISQIAGWANSTSSPSEEDDIFDGEMGNTENSRGEMRRLLKIGVTCCEEDLEKRCDLTDVVANIEGIKERDDMGVNLAADQ